MLKYDKDADQTGVEVYNGKFRLASVKAVQRTVDAPVLYLQIFNTNNPTVGTTAPVAVVRIPAGRTDHQLASIKATFHGTNGGMYLDTGCAYAVTTTHDGSTGPDAGDEPELYIEGEPV